MVAFELAQIHEKAGTNSEAARWYTAAAERFRRAQWKQKAEEALTRLGAPIPVAPAAASVSETSPEPATRLEPIITEYSEVQVSEVTGEPDGGQQEAVFEQPAAAYSAGITASPGRGSRAIVVNAGDAEVAAAATKARAQAHRLPQCRLRFPLRHHRSSAQQNRVLCLSCVLSFPRNFRNAEHPSWNLLAVSSLPHRVHRIRRALARAIPLFPRAWPSWNPSFAACWPLPCIPVDQPEDAPAGPGVFLITDTDQTCYYYIEACQTLRVGIGNLLRSGRGSREGANLKEKLAEHLGINEARVGKYLERSLRRALAPAR